MSRWVLLLVALVVLLAGCKVDTTVDVTVREDGSGVVRVVVEADAEAVKAAESGGVPIEQAVRLGDLAEAGFRVGAWQEAEDGSATIVISRPFDSVDEVQGIVRRSVARADRCPSCAPPSTRGSSAPTTASRGASISTTSRAASATMKSSSRSCRRSAST